jgi:alpha-L-arabinofuranosidase
VRADGEGSLWMDKLSLMPADHIHGWRKDVVAAVKELRPPILRWGGAGCSHCPLFSTWAS